MTCIRAFFIGLLLPLSTSTHAADLITGLGGDSGFGQLAMSSNDDGSSSAIDITSSFPSGINFFGNIYTTLYINNNGNITFNGALGTFTPNPFPIANQPMIAPYWGDVDTRGRTADHPYWNNVYYAFPDDKTMIITWHMVGYYKSATSKLNDFQLVLRRRSETGVGNVDAEFRYGQLEWTTGSASGGSNGLGGTPAQIGFDAGDRLNYYAHPDSRTVDILNLVNASNVGELGVWRFLLREGGVSEPEDTLRDVVAKLLIPASTVTVDTSSFTTTPNSDDISGATRVLTWNYDTISAGEVKDLGFDLELIDPSADSNETVAYRFELDYIDVNDQPVHTELGEYTVEVVGARLEIGLNADKTVYAANTDVTLTSTMKNVGEANADASWTIHIKDTQGALIDSIVLTDVSALNGQSTTAQQTIWNTKRYVAGEYTADLVVVDATIGTTLLASQPFAISPSDPMGNDQLVLSISGSTDRPEYHTTDVVESQISLLNESINLTFNDATLNIVLMGPSGGQLSTQSQALYNLVPGSVSKRKQIWNLDKAEQGIYQVIATVFDDNDQSVLSTTASFSVKEDPIRSLRGSITASNASWVLGEQPQCSFELENSGTLPIDALEYRTSLVRISTQEVIDTQTKTAALLPATKIVEARNYDAGSFTVDHYACVLESKMDDEYQIIDSAVFGILPPPIETEITLETSPQGRLLVLTDEARECSALEDIHIELNWEKELSVNDQIFVRIYDEHDVLIEVESVTAFDIAINSQYPIDEADAQVMVQSTGLIQLSLSAPIHKLGKRYRVEVEAQKGWFFKETKEWSFSTDCDRPLTVGEVVEDVHLLGFKLFSDSSQNIKDLDPYGPIDAPTISEQNTFLETQLTNAGIEYTLVHTADAFLQEMRSADYAALAVLSERPHLSLIAQKELREHVFDGSGLIVAGAHDKRNLFLEKALGVIVTGHHQWATGLVDEVNGDQVFPHRDWVQTFSLLGATETKEYTLTHDQLADDWKGFLTKLPLASEIESYKRRAVSHYQYGAGQSVFFGYDVLAMATTLGEENMFTQEFIASIQSILREQSGSSASKEQAFVLTISNPGTPVSGTLTLILPEGMELVGEHDFIGAGLTWQMDVNLARGESIGLTMFTQLPAEAGTYELTATLHANGLYGASKTLQIASNVAVDANRTFDDLLATAKTVKHNHWYEPHFYLLYGDLVLVREAIEKEKWLKAQVLLLAASNLLLMDYREDVMDLRSAIAEQVRLIGKNI